MDLERAASSSGRYWRREGSFTSWGFLVLASSCCPQRSPCEGGDTTITTVNSGELLQTFSLPSLGFCGNLACCWALEVPDVLCGAVAWPAVCCPQLSWLEEGFLCPGAVGRAGKGLKSAQESPCGRAKWRQMYLLKDMRWERIS